MSSLFTVFQSFKSLSSWRFVSHPRSHPEHSAQTTFPGSIRLSKNWSPPPSIWPFLSCSSSPVSRLSQLSCGLKRHQCPAFAKYLFLNFSMSLLLQPLDHPHVFGHHLFSFIHSKILCADLHNNCAAHLYLTHLFLASRSICSILACVLHADSVKSSTLLHGSRDLTFLYALEFSRLQLRLLTS